MRVSGGREVLFKKAQIVPLSFPWFQSLSFKVGRELPSVGATLMSVVLDSDKTSALRISPEGSLVYEIMVRKI